MMLIETEWKEYLGITAEWWEEVSQISKNTRGAPKEEKSKNASEKKKDNT